MRIYRIIVTQNPNWGAKGFFWFFILLILLVGNLFRLYKKDRIHFSQCLAGIFLFIYLWTVLESTVFTRIPYAQPQYELHLFWSWKAVFLYHDREMLKENILNCLLLLPYGCLIPVALGRKIGWKEGLLIGFGTSSVIEILQLITCRGLFEFDDIVHNGLGCMLGVLLISWFCQKNINIHEGEN